MIEHRTNWTFRVQISLIYLWKSVDLSIRTSGICPMDIVWKSVGPFTQGSGILLEWHSKSKQMVELKQFISIYWKLQGYSFPRSNLVQRDRFERSGLFWNSIRSNRPMQIKWEFLSESNFKIALDHFWVVQGYSRIQSNWLIRCLIRLNARITLNSSEMFVRNDPFEFDRPRKGVALL